jgi:hypothetical protein
MLSSQALTQIAVRYLNSPFSEIRRLSKFIDSESVHREILSQNPARNALGIVSIENSGIHGLLSEGCSSRHGIAKTLLHEKKEPVLIVGDGRSELNWCCAPAHGAGLIVVD